MKSLLGAGTFSGLSDRQLLERFLERRDEGSELAFAVLVERHGRMVLGVCRRIMQDPHGADDAFQATFLVLARRARSIRVEDSLGPWLFGVATRVATRARGDERRRRARERIGLARLECAGPDPTREDLDRAEIQEIIAREVAGLPARFQGPLLLCDLEGTTYQEAARRLGWPVGTLKSRLSRARARLRGRLIRRGLSPSVDLVLVPPLLAASPSPGLVAATTRAALALASGRLTAAGVVPASVAALFQGVLRTMTLTKLKLIAGAVLILATGSAVLLGQASAQRAGGRPTDPLPAPARAEGSSANDDRVDIEMLERAWADAITRRDVAVIDRIMADDFEGLDPAAASFTKASYLADLKRGGLDTAQVDLKEIRPRFFGDTAVVVIQTKAQSSPTYGRTTKVYTRRGGRWQCVASHAGVHGAVFGESAKAAWRRAIEDLKHFESTKTFDTWSCTSCHTMNIHGAKLPSLSPSNKMSSCTACHVADVHRDTGFHHADAKTPSDTFGPIAIVTTPYRCRVEKVHARVGEVVKKGDPLLQLFSPELAAAKGDFRIAYDQWQHDAAVHRRSEDPANGVAVPEHIRIEALRLKQSRDKLLAFGLTDGEIENSKEDVGLQAAYHMIISPIGGTVVELGAVPGRSYDGNVTLLKIAPIPARGGDGPRR